MFCGALSARAGWNLLKTFSSPIVSGFFFDPDNGLIGMGSSKTNPPLAIYWTTNGGVTWTQSVTPGGGKGRVTSIFMKNAKTGYASLFCSNSLYSLWTTNDGGRTWTDFSFGNTNESASIYATSKAIIRTLWSSGFGGSSTDGGRNYSFTFSGGQSDWSNGIDFADDLNGVVTMGPGGGSYYTQDGGVTWRKPINFLAESWGVHAVRGTKIFVTFPEDAQGTPGHTMYWSIDGGMSWLVRNGNPIGVFARNQGVTGHIGGVGNIIYVQSDDVTNKGLFRSDDLGLNWKGVGGPTPVSRDTRFVVSGCNGEVVYAFDKTGGVWKTTDGGDGTLSAGTSARLFSLSIDTLRIQGYCGPAKGRVSFGNFGCSDLLIDKIIFTPNTLNEFSIDTVNSSYEMLPNSGLSIPIVFATDSDLTRKTALHILGHYRGIAFDTTIIIIGSHSSAPGPLVALSKDSITIQGSCVPARGYFDVTNRNCDSLIIDSLSISPDLYKEFTFDTSQVGLKLPVNGVGHYPIVFKTDSGLSRVTTIHLHGHSKFRTFDTTITLIATYNAINGPLLGFVNDTLSVTDSCKYPRGYVELFNRNCDSVIIDNIGFVPNPFGEFSIDTLQASGLNVLASSNISVPIIFKSDSDVTRFTGIHIHAHTSTRTIDTTIFMRAQHRTVSGAILALAYDSVYIETRYCQPLRRYIDIANRNCNALTIDSVTLAPPYPELTIDTLQKNLLLPVQGGIEIPVLFRTNQNLTRRTLLHIVGHSLGRKIDTTIILVAKHSTAPEPILAVPSKTKAGDTVLIPVYLRPTVDSFSIRHYAFHLSYDGDVLSPAYDAYESINTLSKNGSVTVSRSEPNGLLCTVDLNYPLTQDSNLSLPLIKIRMLVTLSRNLTTAIRMDTFSISRVSPLPLCSIPTVEFEIDPKCGDSILWLYLQEGKIPNILSVHPNPVTGGEVQAEIYLPRACRLTADLCDALGNSVKNFLSVKEYEKGYQTLTFITNSIPSGSYSLRIRTSEGIVIRKGIAVIK